MYHGVSVFLLQLIMITHMENCIEQQESLVTGNTEMDNSFKQLKRESLVKRKPETKQNKPNKSKNKLKQERVYLVKRKSCHIQKDTKRTKRMENTKNKLKQEANFNQKTAMN